MYVKSESLPTLKLANPFVVSKKLFLAINTVPVALNSGQRLAFYLKLLDTCRSVRIAEDVAVFENCLSVTAGEFINKS